MSGCTRPGNGLPAAAAPAPPPSGAAMPPVPATVSSACAPGSRPIRAPAPAAPAPARKARRLILPIRVSPPQLQAVADQDLTIAPGSPAVMARGGQRPAPEPSTTQGETRSALSVVGEPRRKATGRDRPPPARGQPDEALPLPLHRLSVLVPVGMFAGD